MESKEDKLQAIEERLAHYEDLHNSGKLSQEDYEILISEGKKEAERVKEIDSVEPDEEHAEAREIWADVQKMFAEGKLTKEEFEKYKKMFEHYQFDAPKSAYDILSKIPYPKGSEILPGHTAEETRNLALTREYHRMRREGFIPEEEVRYEKSNILPLVIGGLLISLPLILYTLMGKKNG